MSDLKSIVLSAAKGEISLLDAEWRLRGSLGSGVTGSQYQRIYNYLDEVAGMIDGSDESSTDRAQFLQFLARLGFPENFD